MITKPGKLKLEEKLVELEKQLDYTLTERRRAAEEGDLRENSAYHFLGAQAEVIRAQIAEIADALKGKMITTPAKHDKVTHGHKVGITFSDGKSLSVTIVGKFDSNLRPGWISFESPLAISILGKGINDMVMVNDREVKVVSIEPGEID